MIIKIFLTDLVPLRKMYLYQIKNKQFYLTKDPLFPSLLKPDKKMTKLVWPV